MGKAHHEQSRRRRGVVLSLAGALAAATLFAGASGTLSSFTTAIINNTNNTATAVNAVALRESDYKTTPNVCTTITTADNTSTCASINKYAKDNGTAYQPGADTGGASVQLTNVGTASGSLTIKAGPCTATPPGSLSLCDVMTVRLVCDFTTQYVSTRTLTSFAGSATITIRTLGPGQSIDCFFFVALPANAPAGVSGQTASQPITWTLNAV